MKNKISLFIAAAALSAVAALPVMADTNKDNNHNREYKHRTIKHHAYRAHPRCRHAMYRKHHPKMCRHHG